MQSSEDLGNTFSRAWQLLTANWIMIVPGIVIAIIAGVLIAVLAMVGFGAAAGFGTMGMAGAGIGAGLLGAAIIALVLILATILTIAYTTGMAGAAWRTGRATLDDGAAAFRTDGGAILTAVVVLFLLGIIAAILVPFTLGLSLLAFWFLFLYTFASVIIGSRSGTDAVSESARLATHNFLTTLIVIILLGVAFAVAAWIGAILHHIPFLGSIVAYFIQQVVAAYAALVIVGEYMKLRALGETAPVGVATTAPPPPPPPASGPPPTGL